jgi:hypothetical protein
MRCLLIPPTIPLLGVISKEKRYPMCHISVSSLAKVRPRLTHRELSVEQVIACVKSGKLPHLPDRTMRWDSRQSSLFIESILLNTPIQALILYKKDEGEGFCIVRGVNRIIALRRFVDGQQDLSYLNFLRSLQGHTFDDLYPYLQSEIMSARVPISILEGGAYPLQTYIISQCM